MKVLKINEDTYRIFKDSLIIQSKLDPQVYTLSFNEMMGFSLERHAPLEIKEKIYGGHKEKIDALMKAYDEFDRPMGIIFSGKKGIGKSVGGRMLANKMIDAGNPVILIDEFIPGMIEFIETIDQECMLFFDEFEKNFRDRKKGDISPQTELLSLFDGTNSGHKKMFVITCNDTRDLNEFITNRPGRFHYHIRWTSPSKEETEEYLIDKLGEEYSEEIEKVVRFSSRVPMNYDSLRAVAFEIKMGRKFEEYIDDINIDKDYCLVYEIVGELSDGTQTVDLAALDLYGEKSEVRLHESNGWYLGTACFNPLEIDTTKEEITIPGDKITFFDDDDKNRKVNYLKITQENAALKRRAVLSRIAKGF